MGLPTIALITAAWGADLDVVHFTGQVTGVEVLQDRQVALPVDADARFALSVRIETSDPPFAAGEGRVFAVHSPSQLMVDVGGRYAFDLTRLTVGPPPRYTALHARSLGPSALAPATPQTSLSAGELAAAIGPPDTACTADADCAVAFVHLSGPYTCCLGCGTSTAGTRSWVAHVASVCADADQYRVLHPATGDLAACYPLACPQGLGNVGCVNGTCTLR